MASLPCKLISQMAFKPGGDVFHRLLANNPQHLTKVTPSKIQACDLHDGEHGTNGSIIEWKITVDGKEQILRVIVQDIDKEKKQIAYKVIQGDLLELYRNILFTYHVETKDGVDYVTWTMVYELLNADNPHPISLMKFVTEFINDIEAHIFG